MNSSKDKSSLYLPNGSTATSPSVCVTTNTPDLRLFVRNTGAASATLKVNMTYTRLLLVRAAASPFSQAE